MRKGGGGGGGDERNSRSALGSAGGGGVEWLALPLASPALWWCWRCEAAHQINARCEALRTPRGRAAALRIRIRERGRCRAPPLKSRFHSRRKIAGWIDAARARRTLHCCRGCRPKPHTLAYVRAGELAGGASTSPRWSDGSAAKQDHPLRLPQIAGEPVAVADAVGASRAVEPCGYRTTREGRSEIRN
jgi:hypothetical protein